ncbi:pimeloyl-ACP methyl ester carboxylesterase [Rhizobium subbaraonis]|uniref:Pimeloyl-ACP methyl ester carboxylesterase n=1 Tax=Rhizobium subbaraonis TaxID=908946 RepID=A0A285UI59_9HYPH|nr:alpha/beta hydrolase [Rhizobium subbaraonis]SOC39931.1 pimeloyl-ACP methyl ester carboxylesterase [Rhizobium subbaraonis]
MNEETARCFDEIVFTATDGLSLYARDYQAISAGEAGKAAVICLAGLSRNSRDFHHFAIAVRERTGRRVVAIDYRGRGRSAWDDNKANYNIATECGDVLSALSALSVDRAVFVGTSRGGLILHVLASSRPDLMAGAILNDIGPVIEPAGLREIARYLNRGERPRDWTQAEGILRTTHGANFPVLSDEDWRDMAEAVYVEKDGGIHADFDPAIAQHLLTLDFESPLPNLWAQFEAFGKMPLMAISGEHSTLLSAQTLAEMSRRHPGLRRHLATGQGHAPLLHRRDVFSAVVDFIQSI